MSGFEVAGALLGAIPLITSALEHYSDGVRMDEKVTCARLRADNYSSQISTMKNMKNYELVFVDLRTSFAASVAIYTGSCHKLLSPLNLPDNKLKDLLVERKKEAWEDVELGESLKKRLGDDYMPYKSLVKQLNKKIILFCKKLKLDEDITVSLQSRSWVISLLTLPFSLLGLQRTAP